MKQLTPPRGPSYLVLLQVGFTQPPLSLGMLVSSYLTFSPLLHMEDQSSNVFKLPTPMSAVFFLWHFPRLATGRR